MKDWPSDRLLVALILVGAVVVIIGVLFLQGQIDAIIDTGDPGI
jgi:Tfp pilus assembly protein PilO